VGTDMSARVSKPQQRLHVGPAKSVNTTLDYTQLALCQLGGLRRGVNIFPSFDARIAQPLAPSRVTARDYVRVRGPIG
jgi:hypothetical protein